MYNKYTEKYINTSAALLLSTTTLLIYTYTTTLQPLGSSPKN